MSFKHESDGQYASSLSGVLAARGKDTKFGWRMVETCDFDGGSHGRFRETLRIRSLNHEFRTMGIAESQPVRKVVLYHFTDEKTHYGFPWLANHDSMC
jgi:hypothetical protein